MAGARAAYIDLYTAFGVDQGGAGVRGRLLAGAPLDQDAIGQRKRDRLRATWHLFDTDEIVGVEVAVSLIEGESVAQRVCVKTDRDGFFMARLAAPLRPGRHRVRAEALGEAVVAAPVEGAALIHGSEPGLAVVSDIDDTVLLTGVSDKLRMVRRVALSTPRNLRGFEGAAALYRRFVRAGAPLVFVSGSPWNLEPRLRAFLAQQGFPEAPLLLKHMGVGGGADPVLDQVAYKTARILEVMAALPSRRFVLIGDSGERDPEIYGRFAREFPHRVAAVYIHRVTLERLDAPRFAGAFVFDLYEDALADAEARGLLRA